MSVHNTIVIYSRTVAIILIITGLAKIAAVTGEGMIFNHLDPVFGIAISKLLVVAGIIELAIGIILCISKSMIVKAFLTAWLSALLLLYRMGLWMIGWRSPCSCLGNITDAIHISPNTADNIMKSVLAYLLIGSYGILFHYWWKNRNVKANSSELGSQSMESGAYS